MPDGGRARSRKPSGPTTPRAAYWAPTLYNASGVPATAFRKSFAYYRNRPTSYSTTRPFPPDFRMIARMGNIPVGEQAFPNYYQWDCFNNSGATAAPAPPSCTQGDLQLRVLLPNCWDGVNLDSPTHDTHVRYAPGGMGTNKPCPSSHPVKLPSILFYERFAPPATRPYPGVSNCNTAALFHGATAVVFEGVQDYPKADRLWGLVERHGITVMGISPTAVRALMPHGPEHVHAHDLSSLRILGSTGESWNPEPYRWLFEHVGGGRLPISNYTGGTEISGGILGCFPIAPLKPCAFAGPIPGMAADVYGEDGRPVRGEVGELVVTRPWPGMTQGFWQDPRRYEETYWSRWPDVWVHGDWAYLDQDGFWFLQGRSDDTLKIAGKRLGPAEVESVLVAHPAVAEAGVIGVPHEVKGEAIVCFVVLRPGHAPSEALREELGAHVARAMGKALRPERVLFARDLPKTRSAKIMRRVIRATYLGRDPGDLSALENPGGVRAIADAT